MKTKIMTKIQELFGITPHQDTTKKSVKELIKKLKLRRIALKKELKEENNLIKREALHDSIKIIKQQIKKGEELLDNA